MHPLYHGGLFNITSLFDNSTVYDDTGYRLIYGGVLIKPSIKDKELDKTEDRDIHDIHDLSLTEPVKKKLEALLSPYSHYTPYTRVDIE